MEVLCSLPAAPCGLDVICATSAAPMHLAVACGDAIHLVDRQSKTHSRVVRVAEADFIGVSIAPAALGGALYAIDRNNNQVLRFKCVPGTSASFEQDSLDAAHGRLCAAAGRLYTPHTLLKCPQAILHARLLAAAASPQP